ncbi:MAG: cell wall-binding repeat-containing protein, partial [Raoultibacter sp.]
EAGAAATRTFEVSGNAQVINNKAAHGGGLYASVSSPGSAVDVVLGGNALVAGNHATGQGGGAYFAGFEASVADTFTIRNNTANVGGGIRMAKSATQPATSLSLKDNAAINSNTAELGGGVCLTNNADLFTNDAVSINENTADLGGGLFMMGANATVTGSTTIDQNKANLTGTADNNNSAGGIYAVQAKDTSSGSPVYIPSILNIKGSASVADNTAGKTTGGIMVDKGATLNLSDSAAILRNEYIGGSSGIHVFKDAFLNIWGSPVVGASSTDNGIYLGSGTVASIPTGKDISVGARLNYEGLEDGAATGSLVAQRADSSVAIVDEAAYMHWTAGGYVIVKDTGVQSNYILEPQSNLTIARLFGADRYETSKQVGSYQRTVASETTLIVASGANQNFPDALAASALSGAHNNAPILLTAPTYLPASTRELLEEASGATQIYVIGDTPSVSADVKTLIEQIVPGANVERIGGINRMQTAEFIYQEIAAVASDTAIIARSMNFPDSLSISSYAAFTKSPIFLTDFSEQNLTQSTLDTLVSGGFNRILVLGDESAVPTSVAQTARDALGLTDADIVRLGGTDRVKTSLEIAEWTTDPLRGSEQLSYDNLALTRMDLHADALTGGVLQANNRSVILLTPTDWAYQDVLDLINAKTNDINEIRFLGDENSISVETMKQYVKSITRNGYTWAPDSSVAFQLD